MSEQEVFEMQRLIDEGIRLAQQRLWQRAGSMQQTLVVARNGKICEMIPETHGSSPHFAANSSGDPLARRRR